MADGEYRLNSLAKHRSDFEESESPAMLHHHQILRHILYGTSRYSRSVAHDQFQPDSAKYLSSKPLAHLCLDQSVAWSDLYGYCPPNHKPPPKAAKPTSWFSPKDAHALQSYGCLKALKQHSDHGTEWLLQSVQAVVQSCRYTWYSHSQQGYNPTHPNTVLNLPQPNSRSLL